VSNKPLKLGELLKRLKKYGVITLKRRGKGSERILLLPNREGSLKGLRFTIRDHGKDTEIYGPVIQAILRRFSIDTDEFWEE
jgi:hypothetical protein